MIISMKSTVVASLLMANASAFTPLAFTTKHHASTRQAAMVDPSMFHDAHQHIDSLHSILSSMTIADATDALVDSVTSTTPDVSAAVADTVTPAVDVVAQAAPGVVDAVASSTAVADPAAVDAVAEVAKNDNGWFGFLEGPIESLLKIIHAGLEGTGMSSNTWGVSIILMTILIKIGTYPLTASQLESTNKMQALQPTIKEIQAKYQSNPEVMNQKIAEIYQTNQVNPLAGCVPSLVQIPVFIGLYRAVLTLANDNALDEPFLFLPNLEGPTYGADPAHGSDWILKNWVDGVPSLGWDDTAAFLTIPVVLVISQFLSMQMMATKDQEQPAVLKFLPVLIGWFSLNVPAALGIYWVANNFITTALTLQIRSNFQASAPIMPSEGGSGAVLDVQPTSTFTPAPIREKPSGFGSEVGGDEIKPITPVQDAEVVAEVKETAPVGDSSNKKRGGKKKRKNKKRKN